MAMVSMYSNNNSAAFARRLNDNGGHNSKTSSWRQKKHSLLLCFVWYVCVHERSKRSVPSRFPVLSIGSLMFLLCIVYVWRGYTPDSCSRETGRGRYESGKNRAESLYWSVATPEGRNVRRFSVSHWLRTPYSSNLQRPTGTMQVQRGRLALRSLWQHPEGIKTSDGSWTSQWTKLVH